MVKDSEGCMGMSDRNLLSVKNSMLKRNGRTGTTKKGPQPVRLYPLSLVTVLILLMAGNSRPPV
jgi:hypothetical protein